MGCDMRCVVEALNKKTGQWECFGVSTADRNYQLFSRIADVRNTNDEKTYIEPIDSPRGWPSDASAPARAWDDYNGLSFSHTWFERSELEELNKWIKEQWETYSLWEALDFFHLSDLFDLEKSWDKAAFTRYNNLRVLFFFSN